MTIHLSSSLFKSVAVTLLLSASAILTYAGQGPQFWNRAKPVTTVKEAEAVKPGDTVVMVCGACKTVAVRDAVYGYFPGSDDVDNYRFQWVAVGSKHKCDHCGGEITVVKGKTKDSMQHNCSMCGEGAAFCCVAPAVPEKK